jgi:predicted metal-binding membrane protein
LPSSTWPSCAIRIGVGSLAWVIGLTAVMVAEKTTRWGIGSPLHRSWQISTMFVDMRHGAP